MLLYEDRTDSGISDKGRSNGKRIGVLGINTRPYRYDYDIIALSSTRLMFIPKNKRALDRFDSEINSLPNKTA